MQLLFNEQDLIDSACVFVANQYNEEIQHIEAELHHDEEKGFSAAAAVRNEHKSYQLSEKELIDAAAVYMKEYHNFDPDRLLIELIFEENDGISAVIEIRK
jgi:magnesium-transporting ATPase (P-type)